MKKTQFSFLLSGDQIYFDFLSLTDHQRKNRKSWKNHILGKSRYSMYFSKFHTEIQWWKSIHCEPTSHNCHTELPCDLSEQHRCIIHSQLCSLCNTKIHFLIPILTVHCLQVWRSNTNIKWIRDEKYLKTITLHTSIYRKRKKYPYSWVKRGAPKNKRRNGKLRNSRNVQLSF